MAKQIIMRLFKLLKYLLTYIYRKFVSKSQNETEIIFQAVEELGGIYVKLIQFVALNTDLLNKKDRTRSLMFFDQVPMSKLNLEATLTEELGSEKLSMFDSIEKKPFATGTFAHVYRAKMTNGQETVIKIKRPNIKSTLWLDFVLLKFLVRIFNLFFYQKTVDLIGIINEFKSNTYKELNYLKEADNAIYFHKKYKGHDQIHIPFTYTDLSTSKIIVQEYVGGVSLTEVLRMKIQVPDDQFKSWLFSKIGTNAHSILKNLGYELFIQGIRFEKFYADPHPGNIKLLPNNKYSLIDFGIVGLSPKNKRNFYNIIKLVVQRTDDLNTKNLGKEFLEWGAAYFYQCLQVVDGHLSKDSSRLDDLVLKNYKMILDGKKEIFRQIEIEQEENFTQMFRTIIEAGGKFNLQIPTEMLCILRTIYLCKAWGEILEPGLHYMRETYQMVLDNVDYHSLINYDYLEETSIPFEVALEKVLDWLTGIAESDSSLYKKLQLSLSSLTYV